MTVCITSLAAVDRTSLITACTTSIIVTMCTSSGSSLIKLELTHNSKLMTKHHVSKDTYSQQDCVISRSPVNDDDEHISDKTTNIASKINCTQMVTNCRCV